MTEYQNLRTKLTELRKARSPLVPALQTVIGQLENEYHGREPADTDVWKVIRSMIKNWSETLKHEADNDRRAVLQSEIDLISQFVPQMLTQEALVEILQGNVFDSLGEYMTYLNKSYPGQIDGKLASGAYRMQ